MKSFSTIRKAGTLLAATAAAAMFLVGCGSATSTGSAASSSNSTGSSVSTSASSTASSAQSTSTDAAQTVADADTVDAVGTESTDASGSGKTLVVYYSATGDTKRDAEEIAKVTGADLFEIPMTRFLSDTRSGGGLPHGRPTALLRPMISPERQSFLSALLSAPG